jgi:4-carboxymuconolactone decarboxylase
LIERNKQRYIIKAVNNVVKTFAEERHMTESETYKKGREIRRQLMGDAMVENMATTTYNNPTMEKFGQYASEAIFGMLWARPGLDLKTRTLICVISDTSTGRWPELELHLRMALRQGWTEDELGEVLLHLAGYIGVPSVREGMIIANKVFTDMATEGEGG